MSSDGRLHTVRTPRDGEEFDFIEPDPGLNGTVNELLGFASQLRTSGIDLGPRVQKIEELWIAAQDALPERPEMAVTDLDLDATDPAGMTEIVRNAAIMISAQRPDPRGYTSLAMTLEVLERKLVTAGRQYLHEDADRIVTDLRKRFDPAVRIITQAHKVGITAETTAEQLVRAGKPAAINAYNALPDAVADLNSIARIRTDMVRHLGYGPAPSMFGPPIPDVACFLADVDHKQTLESAEGAWRGDSENVQIPTDTWSGSVVIKKARVKQVGDRWLELLARGFTLHLNTASEVAGLVKAAKASPVPVGAE